MDDYLDRACEYLGVDKDSVINPRVQGDDYVLIVDKGIAGSPKYYIPLSELAKPKPVVLEEPENPDEVEEPRKVEKEHPFYRLINRKQMLCVNCDAPRYGKYCIFEQILWLR